MNTFGLKILPIHICLSLSVDSRQNIFIIHIESVPLGGTDQACQSSLQPADVSVELKQ